MVLPDAVLAFKLLDNANLTSQEKQLALTACNELTLASMKSAMKRIFGDRTGSSADTEDSISVKQEGAFFVSGSRNKTQTRGSNGQLPVGTNPLNKYGKRTTCAICKSVFHWAKKCPHRSENVKLTESHASEKKECQTETCNITLFTKDSHAMEVFVAEASAAAIIDTACTKTVCGEKWLKSFVDSLEEDDKKEIRTSESTRQFKFGDGSVVASNRTVTLPAKIGDTQCKIETEVVPANIPLLLSKQSLKKARTVLDMTKDTVEMFGQSVDLELTSSGHYCISITGQKLGKSR